MFDMDRWLKRLWMVNGVLLLVLLVFGIGAFLVTWLSGAFGSKNAVLAPNPTRGAAVKPRAVRYSPPRPIWGTKTRIVIVRYGKRQQGAEPGFRSFASDEYRDEDGPVVNLLFLSGTAPGRVLLDKPAYVDDFDYPRSKEDSLQHWVTYRIAFEDTNADGRLDSDDRGDLYVSDLDGSNLRRVLPAGMRLVDQHEVGDGRHLVVTALQVPKDWRGSDEEDSLVRDAARTLARP